MSAIFILAILMQCVLLAVKGSDPDPLLDNPSATTSFVIRNVFVNGDVSSTSAGVRVALDTTVFPAMQSQGITVVQFKMNPCGENLPHTHPRASEMLTMLSGGPLQAGFVDTSGNPHIYILHPGDVILFPRGLLHYELNVGNVTAHYLSALNSQNPGTLVASESILMLPGRALATAFNVDGNAIKKLKSKIYKYSTSLQLDNNSGCVGGKDITVDY